MSPNLLIATKPNANDLLAKLPPPWQNGTLRPLNSGLTNHNYQLQLEDQTRYFLRQGHPEPSRLGICRFTEWQLYQHAMKAELALPCYYHNLDNGIMLTPWCDKPSWDQRPPPHTEQPALLAHVLSQLHRLPRPLKIMAVRPHSAHYRRQLQAIPSWLSPLERALLASTEPTHCWLPCHHDLNPSNLLGMKPWVIDWEYGATGHPGFELALIQRSHHWCDEQRLELEEHYLQHLAPHERFSFHCREFLPWVDYINLLWALLMMEQQPSSAYQQLIATHRALLE